MTPEHLPSSEPISPLGPGALITRGQPLPLQAVTVRTRICADGAISSITQHFANSFPQALEAIYLFPLPPDGAVTRFEMEVDGRTVRGRCREKQAAIKQYQRAVSQGRRAALLTEQCGDVFSLKVGNIPAGARVSVRLQVIERLERQDEALLWRFPTVIAPRYTPGAPISHQGPGVHPDTDRVPDASHRSPPLRLGSGALLDLEVSIDWLPSRLASSLHAVSMAITDGTMTISPSGPAELDRDVILRFSPPPSERLQLRAWTDGTSTAVEVLPPDDPGERAARDAVFAIDTSSSMTGEKLRASKRTLRLVLRGLEPGDRFNLVAFDSHLLRFSADLVDFTNATLEQADRWIQDLSAQGGTEMAPALQALLAGSRTPGRVRTALLITDAQVNNDDELVKLVTDRSADTLLTTVGIDTAVHGGLLKRLARAGGGTCTLLTPRDDIEAAIARVEARLGAPLAGELVVEGGEMARPVPFSLFAGCPRTVYLRGALSRSRSLRFDVKPPRSRWIFRSRCCLRGRASRGCKRTPSPSPPGRRSTGAGSWSWPLSTSSPAGTPPGSRRTTLQRLQPRRSAPWCSPSSRRAAGALLSRLTRSPPLPAARLLAAGGWGSSWCAKA